MMTTRTRSKRLQKRSECASNENWRRNNGDMRRHGRRSLEKQVPLACQRPAALRRRRKPTKPTGPAATDRITGEEEDAEVCIVPTADQRVRLVAYRPIHSQAPGSCSTQTIRESQAPTAKGGPEKPLRTLADQILDGMKIKSYGHREAQITVEEEDSGSLAVEVKRDEFYYSY